MKNFALALILLQPAALSATVDKPDPADFPIKIHVISSASGTSGTGASAFYAQILNVTIDGQPAELTGTSLGVLALGDYPARISPKVHGPHNPNTYDIYRGYDLLMPDGTTRTYTVTRLGPTNP